MTFPKIAVKVNHLELSPGLSNLIEEKLTPLGKLISPEAPDGYCRVEVTKLSEHQSEKPYRVEVDLFAHGTNYRAVATEEQVEKAIDEVRDELKQELLHTVGKRQSLVRKGARVIKDMLKFG